jgi:ABC-type transport system involved in cytochrome c biogenesis permease subunit
LIDKLRGIIAIFLGLEYLPKSDRHKAAHLDVLGMYLALIAFATLAYGVSEGGTSWSSTSTVTGLTIGVIALIAFIFVEIRQKHPLLELKVLHAV